MKTSRAVLIVSLLANAVLLLAWMQLGVRSDVPEPDARGVESESAASRATSAVDASPEATAPVATTGTWAQIDTTDFEMFAHRLKAAGLAPPEVRVIMSWKISEMFPPFAGTTSNTPYWRNATRDYTDPKVQQEFNASVIERQALIQRYVDNDEQFARVLAGDPDELEFQRQRFGAGLSVEKLQALRAIDRDYMALALKQEQVRLQQSGGRTDASGQEAWLLQSEKQAEIAALLTPEEYAEYELRNSQTTQMLRYRLEGFQPSEEEFRTLFAMHRPLEEVLNDPKLAPAERQAIVERINREVVNVLGPDRAADFLESQRTNDQTSRLITRLGLPARTNATVRTLREELTQQAGAVRAKAGLSSADRAAQLGAIAQEAQTQLTTLLGELGFEAYNDLKGEWIRALASEQGTP